MYLLWVFLFSINLLFFWFLNFFSLPGNWLIVGSAALFAYLFPIEEGYGLSWANVGTLAALAFTAEVIEFISSSMGLAKGSSKRSAALALVGSFVGGLFGASIGIPFLFLSPISILFFSCIGAWAGAFIGEYWKTNQMQMAMNVGYAALMGRALGAVTKIGIGAVMVGYAIIASIF
jgi:uncharacterized protein YqgC (DUF456 family)